MRARLSARRALALVLLVQAGAALGLLLYLAVTGRALLVEITSREEIRPVPGTRPLAIPVAGVRPAELRDTYGAARSGGRRHEGIDIMAAEGTPIVAAATGVVVGLDTSALGGISLYHRDQDERTIYFYGHLQRYRAGLKVGDLVRQGEVVAHVGTTGNAPAGTPHLHFSIHTVTDPNRWWRGRTVDPCSLLPCPAQAAPRPAAAPTATAPAPPAPPPRATDR